MFSYQGALSGELKPEENASSTNSSRKNLLNKRVAFPLTGGATGSPTTSTAGGLPPLPPSTSVPPLLPTAIFSPQSAEVSNEKLDGTSHLETREQLESSLLMVSNILADIVTKYLDTDKQEEFNKRLQNLYCSWKEGKLSRDIRQRLATMCESLEAKDFTKAENIQVSLAVDYTADCASWIVVIKNIVTQMKNKVAEL